MSDCLCDSGTLNYSCPKHGLKAMVDKAKTKTSRQGPIRQTLKDKLAKARWAGMKAMALHLLGPEATCGFCDKPLHNGETIDADHILSKGRGGPDEPENMRLAHRSCHDKHHGVPQWSNTG